MTRAVNLASAGSIVSESVGDAPGYMARAWVNFNGTGTVAIRASGNVSSITDNGTGDYTVNFTTALVDANFSVSGSAALDGVAGRGLRSIWAIVYATTSVRINVGANVGLEDDAFVNVSIFR
jgi:hypothetical protein